jgi:hypothetical protein
VLGGGAEPLLLLGLVVVELEVPLPEPLGDELEPELADVLLDPEDPPLDGWLPEPLDVPLPLLGASNAAIGFGEGSVEVVFGVDVAGDLTALESVGSTTLG